MEIDSTHYSRSSVIHRPMTTEEIGIVLQNVVQANLCTNQTILTAVRLSHWLQYALRGDVAK